MSHGYMVYNDKRTEVVDAIEHEQGGRKGWLAVNAWLISINVGKRDAQMFYPSDMFTFEVTR